MGNRTAKFISALIGSIIAGAPLSALSQNAPSTQSAQSADDSCLASPKGTAPQGQHWYYRLERNTKRQCWYLRGEGAKVTQSAQAATPAPKTEAPAPSASPAPRSLQDARAEFTVPQPAPVREANAAPSAPLPAPVAAQPQAAANDTSANQPAVEARWPDPSSVAAAPQPAPAPAPKLADARPTSKASAMTAANSNNSIPLPAADSSADKPTGSLQTLLLVIVGALALAGLTASLVYRFAGPRVRVAAGDGRRRINWEPPADSARAPWAEARVANVSVAPRAPRPRPVDFGAALATAARVLARPAPEIRMTEPDIRADDNAIAPHELDDADLAFEAEAVEPLEADAFEAQTFEAEAVEAPAMAAHDTPIEPLEEPAAIDSDAVDIDAITTILERLAKEGPRLNEPGTDSMSEAGFADFSQSRRAPSVARA